MTAREVLAALSKLDESQLDLPVATEGCDCDGNVGEVRASKNEVFFFRTDTRRSGHS